MGVILSLRERDLSETFFYIGQQRFSGESGTAAGGSTVQALVTGPVANHQRTAFKTYRSVAILDIHQSAFDYRLRGVSRGAR